MDIEILSHILELITHPSITRTRVATTLLFILIIILYKAFGKKLWNRVKLYISGRKKKDTNFNQHLSINKYVFELIKQSLESTHADRILVFEYHNNVDAIGGGTIAKMSCTFEIVRKLRITDDAEQYGLNMYVQNLYHNVPITSKPLFLYKALEKKPYYCEDIEIIKDDNRRAYLIFKDRKVNSFIFSPMVDDNNKVIGHLTFEYSMGHLTRTPDLFHTVADVTKKVAHLLKTPYLYYDNYKEEIFNKPSSYALIERKRPDTSNGNN